MSSPSSFGYRPSGWHRLARTGGISLLVGGLLWATLNNEAIYAVLGRGWRAAVSWIGAGPGQHAGPGPGPGANTLLGQVVHVARDAPAVVGYSLGYVAACLALLFLLFPSSAQRQFILGCYGAAAAISGFLFVSSHLGGTSLVVLNSKLLHFMVSPVPVMVLIPLLWWYRPAKPPPLLPS